MVESFLTEGATKSQSEVDFSTLTNLYPNGHGVNPKKIADLQRMLPFISEKHQQYYENIHSVDGDHNDSDYA